MLDAVTTQDDRAYVRAWSHQQVVLESFLRRERIFLTERLHAGREASARRNIAAELERLG